MTDKNLLELAWAIIANAGGGDWQKETPSWEQAAEKWRDEYHLTLDKKKNSCHVENMKFKFELGDVVWFVQDNRLQQGVVCSRSLVERSQKFIAPHAKDFWPLGYAEEKYAITPFSGTMVSGNETRTFILKANDVYRDKQEYIDVINAL